MPGTRWRGTRHDLSRVLSIVLVLLIGALGLAATRSAGHKAIEVHREDRHTLELVLAALTAQGNHAGFQNLQSLLHAQAAAGGGRFSAEPGTDAQQADLARLRAVLAETPHYDAGAAVINSIGEVVVQWSPTGALPKRDDPGLEPLVRAITTEKGRMVPLSGVLDAGGTPVAATGAGVTLTDGSPGLFVAIYDLRRSMLQSYNENLSSGDGADGWIVDHRGLAITAPTAEQVGRPLPLTTLLEELPRGGSGVLDTDEGGTDFVTAFAEVKGSAWTAMAAEPRASFQGELEAGSRRAQALVLLLLLLAGGGMLGMHRRRETVLQTVAQTDELTGVLNRRGWFELAGAELERSRRSGEKRSLLFVDLDGLKQVNDVLGHREGDRAISDATAVLNAAKHRGDLVGRLGGDEFVMLMAPGTKAPAGRVLDALAAHNATSAAPFELRFSLGLETWDPADPCSLEELVRRADAVMYVDKTSRPDRRKGVIRVPSQREVEQLVR